MTKRNSNPIVTAIATECEALQIANSRKATTRAEVILTEQKHEIKPDKGMVVRRDRLANIGKDSES
jgi:hypothetical protein